jgi:hypothetical protein
MSEAEQQPEVGTTLRLFSERQKLKVLRDECGDGVIVGRKLRRWNARYPAPKYRIDKFVGHIYEYSPGVLGLVFMPRQPYKWKHLRRKLLAEGFVLHQNGDWEGTLLFNAGNDVQEALAIDAIGVRRRHPPSEAQLAYRKIAAERLRSFHPPRKTPKFDNSIDPELGSKAEQG